MAVEIRNLCKSFGDKKVLHNLNMRLEDGGIYCLMGPSGMGKTTLLRIIMNLETRDSGSIQWIDAEGNAWEMDPDSEISAMFQEDRLLPFLSAIENVNMMYEKKQSVMELGRDLSTILPRKCLHQPACELSGGMKRRVSLARTMHFQGKMIILDEPFTGLDMKTRKKVIEYVLRNRKGRILLVATHGEEDADLLGAEIIRLEKCQDVQALQEEAIQKEDRRQQMIHRIGEMIKQMDDGQLEQAGRFLAQAQAEMQKQEEQKELVGELMRNWKMPFMDSIPQEAWGKALEILSGEKKSYETGQALWNVGDAVESLPVVLKGSVAAYMVNGKGQESEIGRFADGSCFGEMLAVREIPSPVMVKALEPTEVVYLSKEKLRGKDPENEADMRITFLWGIIDNMAEKLGIVTNRLDMRNRTIEDKFFAYLEKMPEDEDGCRILDRSLTELAEYFQISRYSLSRELGVMEGKGLIRKVGAKSIKVLI